MDRRFSVPFLVSLALTPVAAALRLWSLLSAVDSQGLPAMHLSMYILIAVAGVFLLFSLIWAIRSSGRSGRYQVLSYDRTDALLGLIAGGLILLGGLAAFAEALTSGPKPSDVIVVLLGLVGGIGLMAAAKGRESGTPNPAAEVLPVIYFLVKLLFSFRGWSTDPIILDYCFLLFASIFILLAFFRGAGFVFDQGKARRALFCAMGAVFFSAVALMDGLLSRSFATVLTCIGALLWQLPVLRLLPVPSAPDPKPESEEKDKKKKRQES